jgi:hypothetical protein
MSLTRNMESPKPNKLVENDKEEMEEREWLKKKLGYGQH